MSKVNWSAEKPSDFLSNFDILVQSFKKFQVQKDISVERLVAGETSDLIELMAWFKIFSMSNRSLGERYNALERRGGKAPSFNYVEKMRSRQQNTSLSQNMGNKKNLNAAARSNFIMDPKTIQKLAHFDTMKGERDFYYSKLRDIDHVLDSYKDSSSELLIQTIRDIIYLSPDKIGVVDEDGHFVVKGNKDTRFDEHQNLNANFESTMEGELNAFDFNSNLNLMSEKMALE